MPSWGSAVLAVIVSVSLGALFNWLAGRRKERLLSSGEERAEEDQELTIQRNIARDALERETLAYKRATDAEARAEAAYKEVLTLREHVRMLGGTVEEYTVRIKILEGEHAVHHEEIASLRSHNSLLTRRVRDLENGIPT